MSEFIIDWDENLVIDTFSKNSLREEIVRCMDCKFKRNAWNGKHPTFSDWFFCAYWGGHELTKLDGFCAWGERRGE